MLLTEQLNRPKQPSQGINESGCWHLDGHHIVLQTHKSNGMVVVIDDPIYTNRYRIVSVDEDELLLDTEAGQQYATQRTSPGYRLPLYYARLCAQRASPRSRPNRYTPASMAG